MSRERISINVELVSLPPELKKALSATSIEDTKFGMRSGLRSMLEYISAQARDHEPCMWKISSSYFCGDYLIAVRNLGEDDL